MPPKISSQYFSKSFSISPNSELDELIVSTNPSIVVVLNSLVAVLPLLKVKVLVHASRIYPSIVVVKADEVVSNAVESPDETVVTEPSESVVVLSVTVVVYHSES